MEKANQINPVAWCFGRMFPKGILVALGLSCGFTQTWAQTCVKCPADANDTAIGTAFGVFVTRNGVDVNVSGGVVGSCELLILKANVSYNAFGINNGIGAG